MKKSTKLVVRIALEKIQEAIDTFESVKGENEQVDDTADSLGFVYADLEFEMQK